MPAISVEHPLVSVVMPVFNAEAYIQDAIHSVLAQTYPRFELVVVDDGSTDGSAARIRAYADNDCRIKPIYAAHGGRGRAANRAIAATRGDLVARLDADDIALPERLAWQVEWMRRTGLDICGGGAAVFQNGVRERTDLFWGPAEHEAIFREMLFSVCVLQPTTMMRATVAREYLYEEGEACEEYGLYIRMARRYRFGNMPRLLIRRRAHPGQCSKLEAREIAGDMHRHRRSLFAQLFPDATVEDFTIIESIAEGKMPASDGELARMGEWLVRLAREDDHVLRHQMARRWRRVCQRATFLGMACYRIYHRFSPSFQVNLPQRFDPLWAECALRLRPGSKLYSLLEIPGRFRNRKKNRFAYGKQLWRSGRSRETAP